MSWGEEQKKEIETIRERKITVKLSDADCDRLARKCGEHKADLEEALEELKDMRADWKPEKEPNMNEEIELIKKWVKEREDFINE